MKTKNNSFKISPLVSGILLAGLSPLAHQLATAQVLEEVIVTSERRAESLQDTPMSVTAFSGDKVGPGGIGSMEDIALQTPNFKMTSFNISEPQLFLRGIGSTNDSAGADSAVGTFIDDVYIGRPSGTSTDLYDLERIEVLRGPQGTLYGRNTAGGAINIFTKKPAQEFEAKAGFTLGNYDLVNVRGYINGPISDTVAAKLTVNVNDRGGYAKNVTTGQELEDDDSKSIRGQILFTPTDTLEILLGFDHADLDTSGSNRFLTNFGLVATDNPALTDPQEAENATFGNNPRRSNNNLEQLSEKKLTGYLLRVDLDMDWASLTSITAYRESESAWFQPLVPVLSTQDGGQSPYEVNDGAEQDADQVSQEFRLSSETDTLKWVTGLFYFKENVDQTERFVTYWDSSTPFTAFNPGDVSFIQDATSESFAVFGQVTWDITQALALTVGARYNKDEKEADNIGRSNIPVTAAGLAGIPLLGIPGASPNYSVTGNETWEADTYRATLDWSINDDHMVYVTYSEGFKSGSFTGSQSTANALIATTPILPEIATNYEVGARTQWFENRVRFNATYFQMDYEDLQSFSLINLGLVASNATAEVSGIETDFTVLFTEEFSISGSYATLDSEFNSGPNKGNELQRAPESSWSITPNYTTMLGDGAMLSISATASYTDEYHFEITNDLRGLEGDVTVIDASAKYTAADDSWDVTLWGKNLDDELYSVHHINGTLGGATRIYAPPRTYGLSFNYHWN